MIRRTSASLCAAAALQCSLLNIRSLDEFYRPQSKPDDIRAEHYSNFPNPGPFLSDDEAKQLHQLVAHLTYRRLREFDTTWNTFHLLSRAEHMIGSSRSSY